jgi:glutamine synthetase
MARTAQHDAWASLEEQIAAVELRQIEIAFADHQGVVRGKRIPARAFVSRARGEGFAFCDASLGWNHVGDVVDVSLTGWGTGYPDLYAYPDLSSLRFLPWREGAAIVLCDVRYHGSDERVETAPRSVLRRVVGALEQRGYASEVGVEIEFHLLRPDRRPAFDGVQCYALHKANEIDEAFDAILQGLERFGIDVEGGNVEYGPGQVEVNLRHRPAVEAADQALLFKYAVRHLARQQGLIATFMAKPYNGIAGNSMHLHASLWNDGDPAFAPVDGAMAETMAHWVGGTLSHLPGIVLYGAPTVNSYKRYEAGSFAPTTAVWGGDNRTVSVRALVEKPASSRVELRVGGADANPYWAIAGYLAAGICGLDERPQIPARGDGNMYGVGDPLPTVLVDAIARARADAGVRALLGENASDDVALLAESEWQAFVGHVSDWDRDRYLEMV